MSYVPSAPPVGDEIFLLKMGEMVLKGLNRRTFEERLMGNARRRLQKYGKFRIYSRQSITYVEPKEAGCDMDGAFATLSRLFGVVGLSRAKACEKTPEAILETAKTYLREDLLAARTFKVESKRSDKTFPMTSIQLSQFVGGELNEAFPHIQADMHHPELTIHVEVRDFAAYVHGDPAPGAGGLPVGVGGKAVSLLSGGIDSPVASWMAVKGTTWTVSRPHQGVSSRASSSTFSLASGRCRGRRRSGPSPGPPPAWQSSSRPPGSRSPRTAGRPPGR